MRTMANRLTRGLIYALCAVFAVFAAAVQAVCRIAYGGFSVCLLLLSLCVSAAAVLLVFLHFRRQDELIESAVKQTERFLAGERDARIDCDEEGELFRLFQSVNTIASVSNAQTEREKSANGFLKMTVSDISHQLKTPLSALNIYNGLIAASDDMADVRRFTDASEAELDRMDTLVKNLLKLTRLDAGAVAFEKHRENIADIMAELVRSFSCRAELEGKTLTSDGGDAEITCDAAWLTEAFANIIKNALDHTARGGVISVSWKEQCDMLTVEIRDNGSGIHPEDIHHIFKRFYRSRFSKDTQGIGLGLPLAKTIIEAHGGIIEAESEMGKGTLFRISFLIPTKM